MIEMGKTNKLKVLIVDDHEEVLQSLADFLRKDFHLFGTSNPEEAIALLDSKDIAVLITDQRMPGISGDQLLEIAAGKSPDTIRILITAYADIQAVIDAVNKGHLYHYFSKPWDPELFRTVVEQAARRFVEKEQYRSLIHNLMLTEESSPPAAEMPPEESDEVARLKQDNEILQRSLDALNNSNWHLRKIQEVLPICVHCGKVRSAEAKWEDVLTYFKNNADFLSHGYCPDCAIAAHQAMDKELEGY